MAPAEESALVLADSEEAVPDITPWTGEPSTVEEMLNMYNVECKMSSNLVGGVLYLTQAARRDGTSHEIVEGQTHKLFLATGLQVIILNTHATHKSIHDF